jgi:hypothetical protein
MNIHKYETENVTGRWQIKIEIVKNTLALIIKKRAKILLFVLRTFGVGAQNNSMHNAICSTVVYKLKYLNVFWKGSS